MSTTTSAAAVRRVTQAAQHPWAVAALAALVALAAAGGFGARVPEALDLPVQEWIDRVNDWAVANRRTHWLFVGVLRPLALAVASGLAEVNAWLDLLGWPGVALVVGTVAVLAAGWRVAVVALAALAAIGLLGQWDEAMRTLSQMTVAVGASLAIGIPLGVLAGRLPAVGRALRPVLDAMQTTPVYVYLLPIVLLFGIGDPAAIVATMIYAIPPAVRLTALGIRSVPDESLEVGVSVGTTGGQLLRTVQLPQALPSIRVGINQTIMMALAMVVIVALIGGTGLGLEVTRGLQTQDVGRALDAGLAIVLIAVILDRITFGAGLRRNRARPPRWAWPAGVAGALAVGLALGGLPAAAQVPLAGALSVADPANQAADWALRELTTYTRPLSDIVLIYALNPLRDLLQWLPWWVVAGAAALAAWRTTSGRLAFYAVAAFAVVGAMGAWDDAMNTASQVAVTTVITIALALPVGVAAGLSDRVETALRPVLDTMQTLPAFVYLVPAVFLFQIGRVPGIVASLIYALPPAVRLTSAGIRQVPAETLEAARSQGATRWQLLRTVQLPLARPSILMGVNQTTMMVLASIIIAGLIGAGGLGIEAVNGLTRGEIGRGMEAGLAIVLLGILLDRVTQSLGGDVPEEERARMKAG